MEQNSIQLKTIGNLLPDSFFIPSYQRGYRWTSREVIDLLNDISNFTPKELETGDKTWYCLQPVVVKKQESVFEVIDGQQRLTTIYLILHYLNQGYVEERRRKLFDLDYETREGSADFLKTKLSNKCIDDSNIDYFFISEAYQTISKWFYEQGQVPNFDISSFESKILHHTKVIWYESVGDDSIAIFTRINSGKIPLTNGELIKALFLNSSNFSKIDPEKIKLRQLEIASEWDKIEYSLQNESFWWFINEKENKLSTRIEFIFDLMSNKTDKDDEHFTFRYFNDKFVKKTTKEINANWLDVKKYFQILEEWFSERELYHKVGFLIVNGIKIKELLKLNENKSKNEFLKELNAQITAKVPIDIDELEYGNDTWKIKNILLLHNIQSMLNNENETNRFPFDRYKKEKWDVEHITAVADKLSTEKHQEDWLKDTLKFVPKEKIKPEWINYDKDSFLKTAKEISDVFTDGIDINDISNLTLLDSATNRSYKNAVFPLKRSTIIEREKTGTFIPLCTKNVFMKFYNKDVSQMSIWGKEDREAYLNDILTTLEIFKK
ncbi:DUF262 domain-containing protein [Flavobacterium ajazii]|uniref:DUF262 domain-containing protein n=1 Tax=Flavobacterium ajazii TaxID=2692318 RepID=UPI0013D83722|nr:DUF262 domain-containing protein [Flavobacterium ajazii]